MSILPEYIIQQVLVKGLRTFRENEELLSMLFRNLEQKDLNSLSQYIRNESIDIALNWPDEGLKLPAIVISLKSESESQAFLGELIQGHNQIQETGLPFPMDELVSPATVLGGGSFSTTGGGSVIVDGPFQASGGSTDTIKIAPDNVVSQDPYEYDEIIVVISEGTGAGQRRFVSSIDPRFNGAETVITVSSSWATIPDDTSIFELRTPDDSDGVTGEPSKLFKSTDFIERSGQQYRVNYQLLILGSSQELTIFLYAIVKAIFIINYMYLQKHGFINLHMSGTDFVPRAEYLPARAYQRALMLEFDHTFDVYQVLSELPTQLRVALGVHSPNISDTTNVVQIVSDTTITV